MDKNNPLTDLINSVGALAEMVALFREGLIKGGATRAEVLTLCSELVKATFGGGKSDGQAE